MLATCTVWLAGCTSGRAAGSSPAPPCYPPDPYDADGSPVWTYDAEADTVTIPWWYWKKVFDYIVDTQAAQEIRAGK